MEKPPIKNPVMVKGIFENKPRNPSKCVVLPYAKIKPAPRKRHRVMQASLIT